MDKKTAIVTGATGKIGEAIARQLSGKGYRVLITCRNEQKGERITNEIIEVTSNPDVNYYFVDLSRKESIREFANMITHPISLLINNAGDTPRRRTETPEGIEVQWATNVLGYFWMIEFFSRHLEHGAPSRVVNVASYWAGNLDLQDPEFRNRHYNNDTAYRQSKQADRMLTVAFSERLIQRGITVNAAHPGDVNSTLSNNLGYGGHETPDQGAATPVWVGTAPDLKGVTGKYFEHMQESRCQFTRDKESIERLFQICQGY